MRTISIAITILSGACLAGTDTIRCEETGLRCSQGLVCAPQQAICVDKNGCGNGILNLNETCDDGNLIDDDGCDSNCQSTGCGNSHTTSGEQCDHGLKNSNHGACLENCSNAWCGDGHLFVGTEQCDEGSTDNNGSCLMNCQYARCGDGFMRLGVETCDDGNNRQCGLCNVTCSTDGLLRAAQGSLYMVPADHIQLDDKIILFDGQNELIFAFKKENSEGRGDVLIDLTPPANGSIISVAQKTAEAINGRLAIHATYYQFLEIVDLDIVDNAHFGALDKPMIALDGNPEFQVRHLFNGVGRDCPSGLGCMSSDDCKSRKCTQYICE